MKIRIERFTEQDCVLWTAWRMRVLEAVFEGEMPGSAAAVENLRSANEKFFLRETASGDLVSCYAKTEDDEIVGCGAVCILHELPSPDNPTGLVAYLMNIFVVPEMRSNGVGRVIVQWLLTESESRGITRYMLETTDAGRALYEDMGFIPADGYMICQRTAGANSHP